MYSPTSQLDQDYVDNQAGKVYKGYKVLNTKESPNGMENELR